MGKKLSLWIIVFALLLAACGDQTATSPTAVSAVATATTAPAAIATSTTAAVAATDTPAQAATTTSGEVEEIKFVGFAGSVAGYQARADEFMKTHPNIKVTVQGIPGTTWGELLQAIQVNIAAGDIPDIADIASEGQRTFARSGIIVPIDDYLARDQAEFKESMDQIHPRLLESLKIDGKQYGLPTVWNNMAIYYNKNVLKEAGLEPPKSDWTIDDFIAMSKQVVAKNTGGADDKWGYAFANQYFVGLVPWMLVHGGNVLSDDWKTSRLNDPDTIAAVQTLHDFVYKDKISPPLDAGVGDFDLFVQNKLAFMGAGMWQVNGLKGADFKSEDYDVVPFPRGKTNQTIIGIGAAPIFAASKHKDAAWEFAKYLSSKQFQETFVVADGWSIPSIKSAADKMLTLPNFPKNGKIFYESADSGVMVPSPEDYPAIDSALNRAFGEIMANSTTVADGMNAAHEEVSAILAKRAAQP